MRKRGRRKLSLLLPPLLTLSISTILSRNMRMSLFFPQNLACARSLNVSAKEDPETMRKKVLAAHRPKSRSLNLPPGHGYLGEDLDAKISLLSIAERPGMCAISHGSKDAPSGRTHVALNKKGPFGPQRIVKFVSDVRCRQMR